MSKCVNACIDCKHCVVERKGKPPHAGGPPSVGGEAFCCHPAAIHFAARAGETSVDFMTGIADRISCVAARKDGSVCGFLGNLFERN